eukprot:gene11988-14162_t
MLQAELESLSAACARLWDLDSNRLVPGRDYVLDVGGGKKAYWSDDKAAEPLFKHVEPNVFDLPTFRAFYDLLDNYNRECGVEEVVTRQEREENGHFLDVICETSVMKYAHIWLAMNGQASPDLKQFKRELHNLWFKLYRRSSSFDSSGFEHVFVGEVKHGKVTGFHNWIQLFLEEQRGNIDYKGFIFPRRRGQEPDENSQIMTIQFAWGAELKSVSSTLIGVSPEFEIALYTMCFLSGNEDNFIEARPTITPRRVS